ncbi:glycosyltransferase family 2 protein [Methylobacterium frigidaeris]|uniref:Glycosyl transferase family 2 n=1 Tax=Methylobacterium frigidaeris TaxID=2038277 RepID=A0AA37HEI8_9HYPH|nr:glycosyltransferase family 2 protein [Methylobacterium frigidaeris]GJD64273.1 hypothetical protein MPEAHAMD_4454 [Methylobacterium frigidaeris]
MNILILAAGDYAAEQTERRFPIWMSEVDGVLVLERQIRALRKVGDARFIFAFRQADADAFFLADIVEQVAPGSKVITIRRETGGAACTALLAADAVDMDDELIVASATDQIDVDIADCIVRFRSRRADAGVLTFPSLHPRYSYVRIDAEGWVVESAEKRPISRAASAGLYWFARSQDFFDAASEMILKDAHVHGRFYICPALNELVLRHKRIDAIGIEQEQYHPLKSERGLTNLAGGTEAYA